MRSGTILTNGRGQESPQQHEARRVNIVLTIILVISIVVGLLILIFDGLLWFDNPKNGHAYALIAFTIIQLALLYGLFRSPHRATKAINYWSAIYLVLLLLNPLTGPFIGVSPAQFASYLFGITPIPSFNGVSCPFLCPPFAISYDLLIACQIAILVLGRRGLKR